MVGLVDYGMGNLLSVQNALEVLGAHVQICSTPEELPEMERLVLPGVGSFPVCMNNLTKSGMVDGLHQTVIDGGKPILGICLGMQAMARRGLEDGDTDGLGWFDAEVVRLSPDQRSLRVPHVGWNDVCWRDGSRLFSGLAKESDFYFVHSFHMVCRDQRDVEATCDYGGAVTAMVRKGNIAGTQFHPEKSQDCGLRVLDNFLKWRP
jgi:glutamine amidotransferase